MSGQLGVRIKPEEEQILRLLAQHLERNIADTVRFSIRETARNYGLLPKKQSPILKEKTKRKT